MFEKYNISYIYIYINLIICLIDFGSILVYFGGICWAPMNFQERSKDDCGWIFDPKVIQSMLSEFLWIISYRILVPLEKLKIASRELKSLPKRLTEFSKKALWKKWSMILEPNLMDFCCVWEPNSRFYNPSTTSENLLKGTLTHLQKYKAHPAKKCEFGPS